MQYVSPIWFQEEEAGAPTITQGIEFHQKEEEEKKTWEEEESRAI